MLKNDLNTIDIILTGDFCPTGRIENMCKNKTYEDMYGDLLPLLLDKDISITNLECPLTDVISPLEKSGPALRADKECISAIRLGGFDVVALSNNHIMDQGSIGLENTLAACRNSGIRTVGAGINLEEASNPLYLKVKGRMVAILNFAEYEFSIATVNKSGANPLDPIDNYYQIQEARRNADIVLVIIHGGNEHYNLPSPQVVKTYRFFADLGATAVVGHHTHSASGYEVYKGAPIFYSLGNFVFDWDRHQSNNWYEGYFVRLRIHDNSVTDFSLYPYTQCKNEARLKLMQGEEYKNFMDRVRQYSDIISDSVKLHERWNEFCQLRSTEYIPIMLSMGKIERKMFKLGLRRGPKMKRDHLLRLLNLFRCQAHKEASIRVLETYLKDK